MQFDQNQKNRWIPKGGGFYLVLTFAVVAMGIGVWGSVNNALRSNPFVEEITAQNTINWENYVTRPVMEDITQAVNEPAKNVPDQRAETNRRDETNQQDPASTAATTKDAAAKPENAPYTGTFTLPFGTNIIKDYSNGEMVKSATMGDWRVHNGVDFAGKTDDPVKAIQAGAVKSVVVDPLWGIVATIDHGQGVVARYCGLSEGSTPREGQHVSAGEPIGLIGPVPCESADGVHLHLEILVNGKTADPLAVMNRSA